MTGRIPGKPVTTGRSRKTRRTTTRGRKSNQRDSPWTGGGKSAKRRAKRETEEGISGSSNSGKQNGGKGKTRKQSSEDDGRKSGSGDGGSGERTSDFFSTGHESSGRAKQRGSIGDRGWLREDSGGQINGSQGDRGVARQDPYEEQ